MLKLPFDPNKPIIGKASIIIDKSLHEVFFFIAEHFFDNYSKWAVDLIEFEPLDGKTVTVGAKAKQIRRDQGKEVVSIFQVCEYEPRSLMRLKGLTADYQDSYHFEFIQNEGATQLTYSFELLHIELFMRPFEKLIRIAIEDGAETTVDNIKGLFSANTDTSSYQSLAFGV